MLSFGRLVMMWNHVLCIFLIIFGSLENLSLALNTSDTECKSVKRKLGISDVKDYITCRYDLWLEPGGNHKNKTTVLDVYIMPVVANFDEDSSVLNLHSWMSTSWDDERMEWDSKEFAEVTKVQIPKPDFAVISAENDDIYNHGLNRTTCEVYQIGHAVCLEYVLHKIRCQTDFTLWPYDRQNCTLFMTSWSHSTEQLTFVNMKKFPRIYMNWLRSSQNWNLSVSRISFDLRPSHYYYENRYHPQISIDFIVDRLHSNVKGRFATSAIIMIVMTLITLWLDPKSIERLAISSLNIIIHMICVRDLHRALPQNGTTIPNMLLFYVNSFVLAILALLLTYVLVKIEDTKVSAPKWIVSSTGFILKSKAGKMLLLCMLDPKTTAGIETDFDGSDMLSSRPGKFNWKYVAIFFGWILFFSFFFVYVLMYAILIPNSASRPPAKVVLESSGSWILFEYM